MLKRIAIRGRLIVTPVVLALTLVSLFMPSSQIAYADPLTTVQLLIGQGAPETNSETWFEWIVVNPTASAKTCTEVRVKATDSTDLKWDIDLEGYPASGWVDEDELGLYWSGSEVIPAYSAVLFRIRTAIGEKDLIKELTWSAIVTGESVANKTSNVDLKDKSPWGGIFYNRPGNTAEQTYAGTYPDGLYAYLYEDSSSQPLSAGTQYNFYVNIHEWADNVLDAGGTLTITIPKEFTSVALVDNADFSNAVVSGGGASDWTISGNNNSAFSNAVLHISFNATTPTGYYTNSNWEFDTRFTGTGPFSETVRYIVEADVLVQATPQPDISNLPNTYGFGMVAESATPVTGLTYFTVTNNSGFAVNITIGGTDMTGGTTWTLADDGVPGANIYGLKAGLEGNDYTIIVKKNTPYNILVSSLADSANQKWGLKLFAPTSFSDGGAKSGTITLTATQA